MAEIVYVLCAATSLFCAVLLLRQYRTQRSRLLLWSTLCFLGLALNSVLVLVDLIVLPDLDLRPLRAAAAFVAMFVMVIGLVWESR